MSSKGLFFAAAALLSCLTFPLIILAQDHTETVHVLLLDDKGRPVTDLEQSELRIFKGKEEKTIVSLRRGLETPKTIGFLVDASPSAAKFRQFLASGASSGLAEVVTRPGDSAFVVKFTEVQHLTCPLTSDLGSVGASLVSSLTDPPGPGGTAVRDTIYWVSSAEFFKSRDNNGLIVFSDMYDNASIHTWQQTSERANQFGIMVFSVTPSVRIGALLRDAREGEVAADATGATSYVVSDGKELSAAMQSIRAELENTYIVSYSSNSIGRSAVRVRCSRKGIRVISPHETS